MAELDFLTCSYQLKRKAKLTAAVGPLSLPRGKAQVKPRQVCSVAGWGKVSPVDRVSDTLQEVELTVQKDDDCHSHFPNHYNQSTQICVGDPKNKKNSFKVRFPASTKTDPGREEMGKSGGWEWPYLLASA